MWRFGFFVVLGLIVVDPATAEQWIGEPPRTVAGNRRRFFTPILGEDERTLAVRAVYLAAHDRQS